MFPLLFQKGGLSPKRSHWRIAGLIVWIACVWVPSVSAQSLNSELVNASLDSGEVGMGTAEPSHQEAFNEAMAQKEYSKAGPHIEALLADDPTNEALKFEKAEWLWLSRGPRASLDWLSQEEETLRQSEITNFLNKLLPNASQSDLNLYYAHLSQREGDALSFPEAFVLIKKITAGSSEKGSFLVFKDRFLNNFHRYSDEVQFEIAALMEKYGMEADAKKLYQMILLKNPQQVNTIERLGRIYFKEGRYPEAMRMIEEGLRADAKSYPLLMLKGEWLEESREYLKAIDVYNQVMELYPSNQAAFNVKMRALMDMGANSLALEEMTARGKFDPVLMQRARGNLAMSHIRWDEPARAEFAIVEKAEKKPEDFAKAAQNNEPFDAKASAVEDERSRWDRIMVLSQQQKFEEVLQEYQMAKEQGLAIPSWIEEAAADAYLYKRQPQKAMAMYHSVLNDEPALFKGQIAIYYTYIDLGQFDKAQALLEALDRREAFQVKERGIIVDNERKEEIAFNKIWLLMYQDRLKKAQKIGEQYAKAAPANIQIRSAMAHLALWRGWPRQSLQEFRVIRTMDPTFVPAAIGYARALYDNMHKKEARELLNSLLQEYPQNRHVQRGRRSLEIDDMALVTFEAYYTTEFPGADEFMLSLRGDQPVGDHNQIFAEVLRRETSLEGDNDVTERFYLGDILRLNNTWKLTGGLSGDYGGSEDIGGLLGVELTPDDYWTYAFNYDSHSIDVPLRSRAEGIDIQDFSWSANYRHSESFNTGLSLDLKDFEDGNQNLNYRWTTDSAVWTEAYWKWRIGTELDYGTFSKQDVNYFSPESIMDMYVVPNVEHTWFRRYEKSLVDRFFVGLGRQWQQGYGSDNVGFLRYELEHHHSQTLSFLLGTVYALHYYDGDDVKSLKTYLTIRKRF